MRSEVRRGERRDVDSIMALGTLLVRQRND